LNSALPTMFIALSFFLKVSNGLFPSKTTWNVTACSDRSGGSKRNSSPRCADLSQNRVPNKNGQCMDNTHLMNGQYDECIYSDIIQHIWTMTHFWILFYQQ
jgi:hypothetical protein